MAAALSVMQKGIMVKEMKYFEEDYAMVDSSELRVASCQSAVGQSTAEEKSRESESGVNSQMQRVKSHESRVNSREVLNWKKTCG